MRHLLIGIAAGLGFGALVSTGLLILPLGWGLLAYLAVVSLAGGFLTSRLERRMRG